MTHVYICPHICDTYAQQSVSKPRSTHRRPGSPRVSFSSSSFSSAIVTERILPPSWPRHRLPSTHSDAKCIRVQ